MFKAIKSLIWNIRTRKMCKCADPHYEVVNSILHCRDCKKPISEFKPQESDNA